MDVTIPAPQWVLRAILVHVNRAAIALLKWCGTVSSVSLNTSVHVRTPMELSWRKVKHGMRDALDANAKWGS